MITEAQKTLEWFNNHVKENGTYPLIAEVEKRLNDAVNAEKQVKNITYEPLLATVCKHNNGNWCKFKGKCPHRTRVYTAPDEDGKQQPTNSYMCYQGHMLNGC